MQIRNKVFEYIMNNKEDFLIYFKGNDDSNDNLIGPNISLDEYITKYSKEYEFDSVLELKAVYKIYKLLIIILKKGYDGYNVFNIINDDQFNLIEYNTIYLKFINDNHFN